MTARRDLPQTLHGRSFRTDDALANGVPRGRLGALDLESPFHGVRSPAGRSVATVDRCRALATRFRPGDAFVGPTAALLWGMPVPRRLETGPLHVGSRPPAHSMRRADVVGSVRPPGTVVLRLLGVPVVSVLDAWAGLATQVEFRDLVAAGDWLVTTHRAPALVDLPELYAFAASLRGRHGSPSVRRAASAVRAGAWSVPETHLRLLLAAAGLPAPFLNHPVGTGAHIPDLSWPVWRVAVEYNGTYHEADGQRRRDLRRAESMVQLGWTTVNVDRDDLYRAPSSVVSRVAQRLRSRGWRE